MVRTDEFSVKRFGWSSTRERAEHRLKVAGNLLRRFLLANTSPGAVLEVARL